MLLYYQPLSFLPGNIRAICTYSLFLLQIFFNCKVSGRQYANEIIVQSPNISPPPTLLHFMNYSSPIPYYHIAVDEGKGRGFLAGV